MTERELQAAVERIADLTGWQYYHTHDSRRSAPGFPDLVLARGKRVIFAELKSAGGRLSITQKEWLDTLEHTPAEVYVWRPKDWPDRVLDILT